VVLLACQYVNHRHLSLPDVQNLDGGFSEYAIQGELFAVLRHWFAEPVGNKCVAKETYIRDGSGYRSPRLDILITNGIRWCVELAVNYRKTDDMVKKVQSQTSQYVDTSGTFEDKRTKLLVLNFVPEGGLLDHNRIDPPLGYSGEFDFCTVQYNLATKTASVYQNGKQPRKIIFSS